MVMRIDAHGEDLTTACVMGLGAIEQGAGSAVVQWGEVTFVLRTGATLETAHRAFFSAAAELRRTRAALAGKPR